VDTGLRRYDEIMNASPTRRRLIGGVAGFAASASLPLPVFAETEPIVEPSWGAHQGGIATPQQRHTYTAAFDLIAIERNELAAMLRAWTTQAAKISGGDIADLSPTRLTLTFGFGAGLFEKDGADRYGLKSGRPAALVDLPVFNGDELDEARTGGDISVQACADDPQVAFDAVRQLARLAQGAASLRWAQAGFLPATGSGQMPRNLMGFKDGSRNLSGDDAAAMEQFVWVGGEGPEWMRGGSYVVLRRIRIALERWDRMPRDFQEHTFGREKSSGAPLGAEGELDPPDLKAMADEGDPVIPDSAHIRIAAPESNDGARILRRGYSYNDGMTFVRDRWPPWREGPRYDAGLFFVCYQRDPRTGFIPIFDRLSKFDMLNQFVTHTGGGLFACPGGAAKGEYIGQRLFEAG